MPSRVFISCGQKDNEERRVAEQLEQWFRSEGYDPCVAIQVQTICDLNAGIIQALTTSDYYVFINLRRDKVIGDAGEFYRGSLYSHQELAIAYAFGFEHILVINHDDVRDEGIQKFIVTNIPKFADANGVLPLIKEAVRQARWTPSYSRHLTFGQLNWGRPVLFSDHTGIRRLKVLHGDVWNNRNDRAAQRVCAHLNEVLDLASLTRLDHQDRTRLKATGAVSYEHMIWPRSHCAFDLLGVSVDDPALIFLNSTLDVSPRRPILTATGVYELRFRFIAEDYPLLESAIRLEHTGDMATVAAQVI